jgi:hypothetical protein
MDINCGIQVSIMRLVAYRAFPLSSLTIKFFKNMAAIRTSLRGRVEPWNFNDCRAGFATSVEKYPDIFTERQVGYFPPPEHLHSLDIPFFYADRGVFFSQKLGKFKLKVQSLISDFFADSCQIQYSLSPVIRTLLLFRYFPASL